MKDTTKANLDAANREVSDGSECNPEKGSSERLPSEDAGGNQKTESGPNGYSDALKACDNLARINQTQAGMITYFMGIVTGSIKPHS